jgi:hypothetical protein
MISQLATEMHDLIDTYARLNKAASQVSLIEKTAEGLAELDQALQTWSRAYPAVEPYVEEGQKADLVKRAAKIRQRLIEVRDRFLAGEHAQRENLTKQIQPALKKLTDDTLRCWYVYADGRVQPLRDQFAFAQQFPRMHTEVNEINAMLAEVSSSAQKLPGRPTEVSAFHRQIAALEKKLQRIKGYSHEQTAFLTKIQTGTATLDDVTPALLEWCQQEGIATSLKVRL